MERTATNSLFVFVLYWRSSQQPSNKIAIIDAANNSTPALSKFMVLIMGIVPPSLCKECVLNGYRKNFYDKH